VPETVLDLACGLHPLGLPWMGLPAGARYHAYDLHRPRVELINRFFQLWGLPQLASCQDILVEPPRVEADVAFFFKEAHRFEQRQRGCNRAFWQAIRARWLLVSLPTSSLTGRRNLVEGQRALVARTVEGLGWRVQEIQAQDELIFCIQKEARMNVD
jgi:16S rRNA (guanine(1405)-N(7))-methyltransferase